ncbi:MAG TPA: PEP-CTERM sorting domain-containing protein [Fimbriimonadaceae bacterium]|nr:PEP-CTERM sorting domain-containing protein [Fimbriimonadaceae bacterium]
MTRIILISTLVGLTAAAHAQLSLDTFVFDNSQFGNTLQESDGGTFSFSNWLNVINVNPGNPALLTGANFETGLANIGLGSSPTYTIGYDTPIMNRPGDDLGIVVARYSEDEAILSVSTDGATFTSSHSFGFETAVDTGVHKQYFYGGGGPFDAELFVHPVDLSTFGVAEGTSIQAVMVTGTPQLDLIRVAGFAVPEPSTVVAFLGLAAIVGLRRQKRT